MHTHKLALITGASRGIGRAFAERLAKEGYDLALTARSEGDLQSLASALKKEHGVDVQTIAADLSTTQGVDHLLQTMRERPLSLLVNNAGTGLGGTLLEQSDEQLQRMLAVNVIALTRLTRALLPKLIEHKGTVLNIASQAAFFPMPYLASYAASKSYVLHLGEALAEELVGQPVSIVTLCPGPVYTQFFDQAGMDLKRTRFQPTTVEHVIQEGMYALKRKKRVHVVGLGTRITTWIPRWVPRALITKVAKQIAHR